MKPEETYVIFDTTDDKILEVFSTEEEAIPVKEKYVDEQTKYWKKYDKSAAEHYKEERMRELAVSKFAVITLDKAIEEIKKSIYDEYASMDESY